MKKTIFLTIAIIAIGFSVHAQFTADNIAVYRYGDGTPLINGGRVSVFVDEYNPATGEKVRTIAISRTANGADYGMEGAGLTGSGAYEAEGYPVLSANGEVLSVIAHNPAQAGQFVVGTISPSGSSSAATLVVDAIGAPRSAVVDGTSVYFNGYQNGVRYKTMGSNAASIRVSNDQNAPRVLTIAETVLGATTATKLFAPNATPNLGSANLPTTQVAFSNAPNFPGSAKPVSIHQVIAISAYGRTLLYVLDDNGSSPKIRKYRSNAGGNDWLPMGSTDVPLTTKSLAAKFDRSGVTLFFTSLGNPGTQNSNLYTIKDAFTSSNDDTKQLTETPVLVAVAPENTTFRGVTLAPGSLTAPTSLNAEIISINEVKLTWTDNSATETGFEIERSADGIAYSPLATVAQNLTSYIDNTVTAGNTYYYRLRAVEGAGHSIYLNEVKIKAGSGMIAGINFNVPPVYENRPVGTSIGDFTVSPAGMQNIVYSLETGTGDADNAKFEIVGNQLKNKTILDFETQQTYKIRVKATSPSNFTYEESFQFNILDVNEAPTINTVGEQNTCAGTEEKTIALSGISPGPESGQTLTASISSSNPSLFASLNISLMAAGKAEIKYKLNQASPGNVDISLTLKDNGGTANGGTDTHIETFKLHINPFPTAVITSDKGTDVDKGLAIKLTASGGASYQWENADGVMGALDQAELYVMPAQNTTYKVTVTNSGGCTAIAEIAISVKDNFDLVIASNLFSPNGDGINDYWKIENIALYPASEVKVFDKTGRIVFREKGYQNNWDGKVSGVPLNEDTYYYLIDFGPGQPKKKGFITLLNN